MWNLISLILYTKNPDQQIRPFLFRGILIQNLASDLNIESGISKESNDSLRDTWKLLYSVWY